MNVRALSIFAGLLGIASFAAAQEPIAPKETIKLFNGKNLDGWTTWLKDTKRDDPRKVFSVKDGILHVSGDGFGYLATDKEYRDYHLSVEYKWGKKTDGRKFVRNSGILLNAIGPDGGAGGTWMSCIECQLAQGCVGDLIVIRGKNEKGVIIPVELKAETALGTDKRPRWKAGGEVTTFINRQLWWHKHEAGFKELLDTRGKDDLECPLGEWTKVECICRGGKIEIRVNGTTVNKVFDVFPAAGKILLQTEGFEIDFRNVELKPLAPVKLFNGKDLDGWSTWLKDTKGEDPKKVFSVKGGNLHISGDRLGYIASDGEYSEYHLTVEYKWGKEAKKDESGIILYAFGAKGGADGTAMAGIKCDLAEGRVGDLLPVKGGFDRSGTRIYSPFFGDTENGLVGRPSTWSAGAGQRWFFYDGDRLVGLRDVIEKTGKRSVESQPGEWTKVECICRGKTIEIRVNDVRVNMCSHGGNPGKILLQAMGSEIDFRRVELKALEQPPKKAEVGEVKIEVKGTLGRLRTEDPLALNRVPPDTWALTATKASFLLDFGEKRELLDFVKRNHDKTVIVTGTLDMRDLQLHAVQCYLIVESIRVAD